MARPLNLWRNIPCPAVRTTLGVLWLLALGGPTSLHALDDPGSHPSKRKDRVAVDSLGTTTAVFAPVIDVSPHAGDMRDVSRCIADCFETTVAYSTPAYVSRDVPRSMTMLYRSGRAKPYGRVTLDVTDATPGVTSFRLHLIDQNGAVMGFANGSQLLFFARNPNGPTRITAEFDASGMNTSAHQYTAYVTQFIGTSGGQDASVPVRIIVVNDQASPYGAGVDLVGVQRIFTNQTGGVLVTDGSGSASFFSGSCSVSANCSFTSPTGDFSVLSTGSNQYKRTYPDGSVVTFNNVGQQISIADRFGNTTQYAHVWNATFQKYALSLATDPVGQTIGFEYRDAGMLSGGLYQLGSLGAILTPGGRNTSIGILANSNDLQIVAEPDGLYFARLGMDAQHRLISWTNKTGVDVRWYGYPYAFSRAPSYIDEPPVVVATGATVVPRTSLREPWVGLYQAAAAGVGTSVSNVIPVPTYDIRAAVTDPRVNSTYFSLNRFGSPTKTYAPLTPSDSNAYNAAGQLTRSVSPTGNVTKYTWVGANLTQVYDSTAGKTVNVDYETQYSLPKRIYGSVADQYLTYDQTKIGWPLKQSRIGSSSATPTTYLTDTFGRPTTITDPVGHVTSYGYQSTGLQNRTSVTAPNGQATNFAMDGYGRTVSVTDPNNRTRSTGYDVLNRVKWTSSPLYNDTTRYQYDLLNNVTVVTDAKGQAYTYQRNALGWVTKAINPSTFGDSSAYDVAGNVVYVRTRQGHQDSLQYDALGRVTKKIGMMDHDTITYAFDPGGRWVSARTVSRDAWVSTDTIFTDSIGRTVKESTLRPGATSSWYVASFYGSTDPGRTSVNAYKTGGTFAESGGLYIYDASKRLQMIQLATGGQTSFGYNADQLDSTVTLPSGLKETTLYTSSHAMAKRTYSVASVQSAFDRAYRTDSLARLVERAYGTAGQFQNFYYDVKGRFNFWEKWSQGGSPTCVNVGGYGYDCSSGATRTDLLGTSYDKVENPTDLGATVEPGNRLMTYNGLNMYYGLDGGLSSKGNDIFDWDDFGQLKTVTRSGTLIATFDYDGFGRRVRKVTTSGTVQYVWDGDQIILEADGAGTTTQAYSYYPGMDRLHSVTAGGQTYYASIEPATGDVNGLINGATNAVAAQYAYTPWGDFDTPDQQLVNGVRVNSMRWKGLVYDPETGLYYMRARYYDPKIRRFISEDPIGLAGGINLYVFAGGDPVNGNDPSGLGECKWVYYPGAYVTTYDIYNGNHSVWTDAPRMDYECQAQTAHRYDDPAARGSPATGQTTGGGAPFSFSADATRVAPPLDRTARMYRLSCQAGSVVTGWSTGAAGGRVVGAAWGAAKYGEALADVGAVAGGLIGGLIGAEGVVTAPAGASFGASAGRVLGYGAAAIYGARKGGQIFGALGAAAGTFAAFSCH